MLSILTALLLAPSMAAEPGLELRFSGLLSGNRLTLEVANPGVTPRVLKIQLFEGLAKPGTIRKLEDLAGHVRIASAKQALDYVRLRTSLATWDFCWDGDLEAEITSAFIARRAANYGIVPDSIEPKFEGWLGVLSDKRFKHCGIAPAKVWATRDGFVITRSLAVWVGKARTVEEYVGSNGSYRRKVLRSFAAPKGYDWYFPMKE